MSKVLTLGELIAVLDDLKSPAADVSRRSATDLAESIAKIVSEFLDCDYGVADIFDGQLYVSLRPRKNGQPMPEILTDYDSDGEWNTQLIDDKTD